MASIDNKDMQVAALNDTQLRRLVEAEKEINGDENNEIYLLAVQRP